METGAHIRLVLGRAAKAIERIDRGSIAGTGITVSDFSILEALLHKGPLPINTIGEKVLLTSGSMTAAANRLEEKGLIKRIQDPSDGRCFYLHLTKTGRRLIKEAFDKHARNLEKIVDVLTAEERSELLTLLKKVGKHAQNLKLK
ncbi:MarR family transcriptional regulator [Desulfosarcina widdelii]|uniref:MarR family transcriptional regulator n=1 Tax=Desulfosarcina widdelii TaxID=947919 RepID=A0A5K7Z8Z1_9BACT|nr:MarR family transcriptional regulator [Desulfosarcina widdelii]BBO78492.1 MarR family transcriptional regulator [Desulfosarcina widdelii]